MSPAQPGPPLRIAVLGDFDGMHTRRWLQFFVERGHEVHAISYYTPTAHMSGVQVHTLSGEQTSSQASGGTPRKTRLKALIPPSLQRLAQAIRYQRAGLQRVLKEIDPDVFHAHYAVEHAFYGSFAGFHPYIVSSWGSDLLVESQRPLGRLLARRALHRADLVTANDGSMAQRAVELGVPENKVEVVHLGIERLFLDAAERTVNRQATPAARPTVISDRALEPNYNVDRVIRAFARVHERLPEAQLLIAGDGSQRSRLEELGRNLLPAQAVRFLGQLQPESLADVLAGANVYVSVPASDSFALSTVEAMAAGCFPVISDLPSMHGWVRHGETGLLVSPRDEEAVAAALLVALNDFALRQAALEPNRETVSAQGLRENNMRLMERHYYRLAGRPMASSGEAI